MSDGLWGLGAHTRNACTSAVEWTNVSFPLHSTFCLPDRIHLSLCFVLAVTPCLSACLPTHSPDILLGRSRSVARPFSHTVALLPVRPARSPAHRSPVRSPVLPSAWLISSPVARQSSVLPLGQPPVLPSDRSPVWLPVRPSVQLLSCPVVRPFTTRPPCLSPNTQNLSAYFQEGRRRKIGPSSRMSCEHGDMIQQTTRQHTHRHTPSHVRHSMERSGAQRQTECISRYIIRRYNAASSPATWRTLRSERKGDSAGGHTRESSPDGFAL